MKKTTRTGGAALVVLGEATTEIGRCLGAGWMVALQGSDHLLNVPNEGADADFLVALVEFADGLEELVDAVVGDDGEDGVVHLWPCVGAPVGVAVHVAAALYVFPLGEAADAEGVEHVFGTFVVGLVVDYKDTFHIKFRVLICEL